MVVHSSESSPGISFLMQVIHGMLTYNDRVVLISSYEHGESFKSSNFSLCHNICPHLSGRILPPRLLPVNSSISTQLTFPHHPVPSLTVTSTFTTSTLTHLPVPSLLVTSPSPSCSMGKGGAGGKTVRNYEGGGLVSSWTGKIESHRREETAN